ncbi:TPA: hypothetical protein NJ414_004644 [Vibrio parahaemolyticus]|nr:hypothetical protein [Vibrio parahaemolyticus]HCE2322290.1 hypothetical protein [Vibrio parahaemolyticus]HCE2338229.1 hypothetical protein [Vibrio parahaemolyticus]HCE2353960.1 hypothetical protein [Vibrio parahaemolyticus]HCE2359072.1 hypothetical protein [Vibrio parahaemolyticus]
MIDMKKAHSGARFQFGAGLFDSYREALAYCMRELWAAWRKAKTTTAKAVKKLSRKELVKVVYGWFRNVEGYESTVADELARRHVGWKTEKVTEALRHAGYGTGI